MRQTVEECVHLITGPNAYATVFIFAGAGAGHSVRIAEDLRLPLGGQIRDHLLEQYYPTREMTAQQRADRFVAEAHCPATPDFVWHWLVQRPGRLATYYPELTRLFGPGRPVPSSYYMLARWFFTAPNVGGVATTNFDEKLNQAFETVANSLGKRLGLNYHVPSVAPDFEYFADGNIPRRLFVQKLHGTLEKPWSIVAGIPPSQKPDKVETKNPAYQMLQTTLATAEHWVFIGYSFQDDDLRSTVLEAYKQRASASLYIVDLKPPDAFIAQCTRARPDGGMHVVESDAETFLETILRRLGPNSHITTYRLPDLEKNCLHAGPTYIPGCKGRMTSGRYQVSPRVFKDPVHSSFAYSEPVQSKLIDLIDCGEMQRLRYIKQLSFVHLKHPGATHDRFSHSLGVTHLADRLFTDLREHAERVWGAKDLLTTEAHLSFTAAALFHDTGHGPLGHTMDLVRRRISIRGGHELDSLQIFDQATHGRSFADLDAVLDATAINRAQVRQILSSEHPLGLILSNPGLDLDRLDFLLRDGYNTICTLTDGTGGEHQVQAKTIIRIAQYLPQILSSIRIREDPATCRAVLAVAEEQKEIISDLGGLYAYMYENVYHCWQNVAAQTMIAIAIEELLRSAKYQWLDVIRLTDIEMFAALEESEHPKIQELAYLVKYRRLFEYAGELRFEGTFCPTEAEVEKELGFSNAAGARAMTVLLAVVKPKEFRVRFAKTECLYDAPDSTVADETLLAKTPGRIMFFRWPGSDFTLDSVVPKLQTWIEQGDARFLEAKNNE